MLISFSKHKLKPHGETVLTTKYKGKCEDVLCSWTRLVESVISGLCETWPAEESSPNDRANPIIRELEDYPELFTGLGCLPGTYHIELTRGANPVIHPPRKVPVPQREKVIEELKRMDKLGVIVRQEDPTDWVNSQVVVQKPNGSVRLCIDPRDLNAAMKRSHYPMRTVDEVVNRLKGSTTFSILDAKSGYWQLKLDEESSRLCTFDSQLVATDLRHFPLDLKCAPELFQRTMDQMVEDLDGVEVIMDDVIIHRSQATYDEHLQQFLERALTQGLKFNKEKCKIRQQEVPYVGHLLSVEGLKIDPRKAQAVQEMSEPENKEVAKRFLGFVQFLSRYLPSLSTLTPHCESRTYCFAGTTHREKAFRTSSNS